MTKLIILLLLVIGMSICIPIDAYAARSGSHGHSHGRGSLNFRFPLPSYRSHSRPVDTAPAYSRTIYPKREHPLPRIYTLDKPLVDDPTIYRRLNFSGQRYSPSGFYKYDQKRKEYSTPNVLHADSKVVNTPKLTGVEINGELFYYDDGFFYKESGDHFIVVAPVVNIIVPGIPRSSANLSDNHYEYNGIYYRKLSQGFQVVGVPSRLNIR